MGFCAVAVLYLYSICTIEAQKQHRNPNESNVKMVGSRGEGPNQRIREYTLWEVSRYQLISCVPSGRNFTVGG